MNETNNVDESTQTKDQRSSRDNDQPRKNNKFAVKEEITEDNCKFAEGQMLKFTRVRFPGHAKSYAFLVGQRKLMYGQKVMAMSDRGMAVGYINSFEYELPFKKNMLPLRSINKIATDEDMTKERETYKKQKEAETISQRLIEKHNLSMNLTHVEFTQFGKKVVFYFVAPARVDFRGLVKDLVNELKLRIELRQISVRDRAASQGALGPCGRELCCSSFLSKYGNVSVKMAKNQNLTLNYSKLNGVCGQLKCCLQYEDEVYTQKRKRLPDEGSFIQTKNGDKGKIHKLNLLSEQFDLLTEKGQIRRYTYDQFEKRLSSKYAFPRRFDNISDETATTIGLNDLEAKKVKQFERDIEKVSKRAKLYAQDRMKSLREYLPPRGEDEEPVIDEEIIIEEDTPEVQEDFEAKKRAHNDDVESNSEDKKERGPRSRNNTSNNRRNNQNRKPGQNNRNRSRNKKPGANNGNTANANTGKGNSPKKSEE